jgi:hypothetical protein
MRMVDRGADEGFPGGRKQLGLLTYARETKHRPGRSSLPGLDLDRKGHKEFEMSPRSRSSDRIDEKHFVTNCFRVSRVSAPFKPPACMPSVLSTVTSTLSLDITRPSVASLEIFRETACFPDLDGVQNHIRPFTERCNYIVGPYINLKKKAEQQAQTRLRKAQSGESKSRRASLFSLRFGLTRLLRLSPLRSFFTQTSKVQLAIRASRVQGVAV